MHAQRHNLSTAQRLIGSWRLLSYQITNSANDSVVEPLGADATGWLIYTPDGLMSVQIMAAGRPAFVSNGVAFTARLSWRKN